MKIGEEAHSQAWTAAPSGAAFRDEIPEILEFCRIERWTDILLEFGDKKFVEDDVMWADSSFFRIFDFKLRAIKATSSTVRIKMATRRSARHPGSQQSQDIAIGDADYDDGRLPRKDI